MTLQTKHNQQVGQSVLEVRTSYSSSKYIVLSKSSESIYNRLNLSNDDLTSFILVSQKTTWPDLIRFSIPEDNTLLDSIRFAEYVDNSVRKITPLYTAEEKINHDRRPVIVFGTVNSIALNHRRPWLRTICNVSLTHIVTNSHCNDNHPTRANKSANKTNAWKL